MPQEVFVSRAALHMWEEPVISGTRGSGTVFFTGCNLKCVFCQNYDIAHKTLLAQSKEVSTPALSSLFLKLQDEGAANINLVTPTHYIPQIREALLLAKKDGLTIPVVYNTGSYENVDSLAMLKGLIDVYLPDLKYADSALAGELSNAPDYFEKATLAIKEMFRQVGTPTFENGYIKKGIIVRHLVLPGHVNDSKKVLQYLYDTYGDQIYISIMNQYTPMKRMENHKTLHRPLTKREYAKAVDFALSIGIQNAFIQEGDVAKESFIPPFDLTGI